MSRLRLGVPKASEHYNSSSHVSPNPKKADLVQLICSPERSANKSKKMDRFFASSIKPSIKNVMSSVYCSKGMPSE